MNIDDEKWAELEDGFDAIDWDSVPGEAAASMPLSLTDADEGYEGDGSLSHNKGGCDGYGEGAGNGYGAGKGGYGSGAGKGYGFGAGKGYGEVAGKGYGEVSGKGYGEVAGKGYGEGAYKGYGEYGGGVQMGKGWQGGKSGRNPYVQTAGMGEQAWEGKAGMGAYGKGGGGEKGELPGLTILVVDPELIQKCERIKGMLAVLDKSATTTLASLSNSTSSHDGGWWQHIYSELEDHTSYNNGSACACGLLCL